MWQGEEPLKFFSASQHACVISCYEAVNCNHACCSGCRSHKDNVAERHHPYYGFVYLDRYSFSLHSHFSLKRRWFLSCFLPSLSEQWAAKERLHASVRCTISRDQHVHLLWLYSIVFQLYVPILAAFVASSKLSILNIHGVIFFVLSKNCDLMVYYINQKKEEKRTKFLGKFLLRSILWSRQSFSKEHFFFTGMTSCHVTNACYNYCTAETDYIELK